MATPSEKLATSLEVLKKLQNVLGIAVVKSNDISRTHKDRLIRYGFLKEVLQGWYISSRPDEDPGDTTSWYMSFWYFVAVYFNSRFGREWCLSPEQSLSLHSGNFSVPRQLLVRSPKASNNIIQLIYGTSFFDLKLDIPEQNSRTILNGIQLYSLNDALIAAGADFFVRNPTDASTSLYMTKEASGLLGKLLEGGKSTIAGRLAGAFRNIGNSKIADEIFNTMRSAGYDIREADPFSESFPVTLNKRLVSPYANRIMLMWQQFRPKVMDNFPQARGLPSDIEEYLRSVEENYIEDAYHSLSIEGYRVTPELIEQVRRGKWNPDDNQADRKERNAMAARGYYLAFQSVKNSIRKILEGQNPGDVADNDLGTWYRELFAPSVMAGIIKASDLAGYRSGQVFIKGSMHTPLPAEAVRDAMPVLFDLLREETEPCVRAVLGHFILVYIHPYLDGNGRIGRFLFNTMLASGGYPWIVIQVDKRKEYMAALEKASVGQDITDFVQFLSNLLSARMKK